MYVLNMNIYVWSTVIMKVITSQHFGTKDNYGGGSKCHVFFLSYCFNVNNNVV